MTTIRTTYFSYSTFLKILFSEDVPYKKEKWRYGSNFINGINGSMICKSSERSSRCVSLYFAKIINPSIKLLVFQKKVKILS